MRLLWVWMLACLAGVPAHAERFVVRSQAEYRKVTEHLSPGDEVVLANGEWRDFDAAFAGKGTARKPIVLTAEQPGRVLLTRQSSLRLGGEHLLVRGLVFKDGYSPRGAVIAFRLDGENLANRSRVTETVIDGFSKPGRYDDDYWVSIYGRGNRFDHNQLVGKTNKGVTLAVHLDTEASRNNGHRIDHNYFGPRPVLGSNGGETIRIGTSAYSMFGSGTIVENNLFDRCDGEVEIISSKSNGNIFRGNLFLRSRGSLTLRHGDGALVERNVFLGHGKDYTGGIRVINRDQTVRGNYMEGLRGTGFASALTVMNGVPNSPVNRYVQVTGAAIEHNTIVDSAQVALGAGASAERTAPPVASRMRDNLLSGIGSEPLLRIDADVSGIGFSDNVIVGTTTPAIAMGQTVTTLALKRGANGLLYPPGSSEAGAPRDLAVMSKGEVGVSWYPKPSDTGVFDVPGKVHVVRPGSETLFEAAAAAASGDILALQPGEYLVEKPIPLGKTLTIRGPASNRSAAILLTRPSLIDLETGANLRLENLSIDGSGAPDTLGNSVIRTGALPIKSNMTIELSGVTVSNLSVNAAYNVLTLGRGALAERVSIRNSSFANITGAIVSAAAETEDYGQYNVEYLDIAGNSFADVGGPIAAVYRGGTDESTFGPAVSIRDNRLRKVGQSRSGAFHGALVLHGVQTTAIEHNVVEDSGPLAIIHTVGTPSTRFVANILTATPALKVEERNYDGPPRIVSVRNTRDGKPM